MDAFPSPLPFVSPSPKEDEEEDVRGGEVGCLPKTVEDLGRGVTT